MTPSEAFMAGIVFALVVQGLANMILDFIEWLYKRKRRG